MVSIKDILVERRREDGVEALVEASGRVSTKAYNNGTWMSPSCGDPVVFGFWLRRSRTAGREAFLLRRDGWSLWRPSQSLWGERGDAGFETLDRFLHGSWSPFFGSEGGDAVVRSGGSVWFSERRPKAGIPFSKIRPAPARPEDSFSKALMSASKTEEFQEAAVKSEPLLLERPGRLSSAHERLEREMFLDRVDPDRTILESFEEKTGNGACSVRLWSSAGCVVATGYAPRWFDGGMELVPAATACAVLD